MITYEGLTKAETLCALYNNAKVQGLGFLQAISGDMSIQEAEILVKEHTQSNGTIYFDYVHGRVIKVNLTNDKEFDERLYDRDNGQGSAQKAINDYTINKRVKQRTFNSSNNQTSTKQKRIV